jgi:hypothetical protein
MGDAKCRLGLRPPEFTFQFYRVTSSKSLPLFEPQFPQLRGLDSSSKAPPVATSQASLPYNISPQPQEDEFTWTVLIWKDELSTFRVGWLMFSA